ncbi:MAG TPA: hypothetical protein VK210_11685 [Terriglobia bacterium]|nr:hypothetical protein [Terriglobia bacterium]
MRIQIATLIAVVSITFVSPIFAQKAESTPGKLEMKKWDAGGSLGMLGARRSEFGGAGTNSCSCTGLSGFTANLDVGRYLSPHLKAEAGLMWSTPRDHYSYSSSYLQPGQYTSTYRSVHPTSVSGAFTYQFLENVFAHPYVSAGIRVTSLYEESRTYTYGSTYTGPPNVISGTGRSSEVRPFVAAGFKSYFNEWAYMRSEVLTAFDKKGPSHGTLRIGFGIDF